MNAILSIMALILGFICAGCFVRCWMRECSEKAYLAGYRMGWSERHRRARDYAEAGK